VFSTESTEVLISPGGARSLNPHGDFKERSVFFLLSAHDSSIRVWPRSHRLLKVRLIGELLKCILPVNLSFVLQSMALHAKHGENGPTGEFDLEGVFDKLSDAPVPAKDINMRAGHLVVCDGNLLHQGGPNSSGSATVRFYVACLEGSKTDQNTDLYGYPTFPLEPAFVKFFKDCETDFDPIDRSNQQRTVGLIEALGEANIKSQF